MDGILLINKPLGWTSFDVVNYVRKIVAQAKAKPIKRTKVGHSGTLDPQATGLLVLMVGSYTKQAPELSKQDKTYDVVMRLGEVSTTGDSEGEISPYAGAKQDDKKISREDIEKQFKLFTGTLEQIPPAFSAIKVNGQRAYKLARAGQSVLLKARPVTIYSLKLVSLKFPEVNFIAQVSSGTYIRSLVSDIGESLKCGAYMSGLMRTKVGGYQLDQAVEPKALNTDNIAGHLIRQTTGINLINS